MPKRPMPLIGTGQPSTDLRDNVASSPLGAALPLVHVTEMGRGKSIIMSGQLQASRCKVFGRDLLYFFLGKPAYRIREEGETSQFVSRYPCVFIVDPDYVTPTQVYPFDTGAAHAGFYENSDPHLGIKDYLLEGTYEAARRQVGFAFENVEDYFDGRIKPDLARNVPHFDQGTLSYITIANQANRGTNTPGTYDDRASAIEIATEHHVSLKGTVQLVILPQQFLEGADGRQNVQLLNELNRLNLEILTYDWQSTKSPADYRPEINAKVLAHFKKVSSK